MGKEKEGEFIKGGKAQWEKKEEQKACKSMNWKN